MWLARQPIETDTGDVEGGQLAGSSESVPGAQSVICWRGKGEEVRRVPINKLTPGSVIILRLEDGGYDAFGWAPDSAEPVTDLGDEAFFSRTGRIIERCSEGDDKVRPGFRAHYWSKGIVFEQLASGSRSRLVERQILLDDHSLRVAAEARDYAESLGLDPKTLYAAGLYHDRGKAHPGWQLLVNGGDPVALQQRPLAKGPYVPSPLSRLPRGWRHEAESLKRLPEDADDLVKWLVATHHGHARPFWPIPEHGIGLADMMDRLQGAQGYWTLALLETVLRCADRKVSEKEMEDA